MVPGITTRSVPLGCRLHQGGAPRHGRLPGPLLLLRRLPRLLKPHVLLFRLSGSNDPRLRRPTLAVGGTTVLGDAVVVGEDVGAVVVAVAAVVVGVMLTMGVECVLFGNLLVPQLLPPSNPRPR